MIWFHPPGTLTTLQSCFNGCIWMKCSINTKHMLIYVLFLFGQLATAPIESENKIPGLGKITCHVLFCGFGFWFHFSCHVFIVSLWSMSVLLKFNYVPLCLPTLCQPISSLRRNISSPGVACCLISCSHLNLPVALCCEWLIVVFGGVCLLSWSTAKKKSAVFFVPFVWVLWCTLVILDVCYE